MSIHDEKIRAVIAAQEKQRALNELLSCMADRFGLRTRVQERAGGHGLDIVEEALQRAYNAATEELVQALCSLADDA